MTILLGHALHTDMSCHESRGWAQTGQHPRLGMQDLSCLVKHVLQIPPRGLAPEGVQLRRGFVAELAYRVFFRVQGSDGGAK